MNTAEKKQQLCEICHQVYDQGMVCGSGGNISIRDGENIWITPSGYALIDIHPNDLVLVHSDGSYDGPVKPSKETFLHLTAYRSRPDIHAIVHLHSYYSIRIALGCSPTDELMPAYTSAYAVKVGHIGLVPFLASGSVDLAQATAVALQNSSAVLLQNHGIIAVGKNLRAALNLCEDVEFNARIHLEQNGIGALTKEQVETL